MKNSVCCYLKITSSKFPQKDSIDDKKNKYSFAEMDKIANGLANKIISILKSEINFPIAVYLPKSAECMIAFSGIHYSGNFYSPIDVKMPMERINLILNNLQPKLIVTSSQYVQRCLNMGFLEENIIEIDKIEATDNLVGAGYKNVIDTDPAYVLYTSGSTGTPKGVCISHRSIIDYIDWAIETYGVNSNDIIANQAPFYFDNSVFDIYLMMATGAKLIIVPESLFMFPAKLMEFVAEEKITQIFWVPSVLNMVANMDALSFPEKLSLKRILFAGEVMYNKQLNYWRNRLPNVMYVNMYGPTEITVDCTYYVVNRDFTDDEPLPIGIPCKNTDVIVLDENNHLIDKANIIGELCVRGSSLALGYWNNPQKTIEAFIQNPLQKNYPEKIYHTGDLVYYNEYGEIMYSCRKDNQIKHMGYRIELGEIETAVSSMTDVKLCCAIYDNNKSEIIIFYVAEHEIEVKDFRLYLQKKLPKYMIPTKYIYKNDFELNSNGKIDRLKLKSEIFKI